MEKNLTFALAGNPNSGKTTLFNALTGSTAYVGNWPGVTVEKRSGTYKSKKLGKVDIIDLPGIYSLSPYSPEEVISRNYILNEKPDLVINVVDATNLERNLYLTTQLLEIDVPLIVALNMADALDKNHTKIDTEALSKELGVPVIAISALQKSGLTDLMALALKNVEVKRTGTHVFVGTDLEENAAKAHSIYQELGISNPLFHAVNALQKDAIEQESNPDAFSKVQALLKEGEDYEAKVADYRYKYIASHYVKARKFIEDGQEKSEISAKAKLTLSDKIDRVLTNKWLGIPIFIAILLVIFHFTFSENFLFLGGLFNGEVWPVIGDETSIWAGFSGTIVGEGGLNSPGVILMNLVEALLGVVIEGIRTGLEAAGSWGWFTALFCDGILTGAQAVMMFLPQILLLFLFFSILEDSGYMARVAFILDRIFRKFGLSGRAVLPMIMGFGCSVPAIMNTRTLTSKEEKIQTIRVIPFFSCGAKLPILTGIAGAMATLFGLPYVDLIVASMYLMGVIVAIIAVITMHLTTQRKKVPPFIMELPAYHRPQLQALMIHLWDKTKHFVKKAFTIILLSNVIIWLLMHFSWNYQYLEDTEISQSILASLGMLIQPLFTPLGFGSQLTSFGWVLPVAALTGLIAKENATGVFTILAVAVLANPEFADNEGLALEALLSGVGASAGACIAFIAFNMLTIPCFAAVATAHSELPDKKSFKWTILFWIAVSYLVGTMIYTSIDYTWTLAIWLPLLGAFGGGLYLYNKKKVKEELARKVAA